MIKKVLFAGLVAVGLLMVGPRRPCFAAPVESDLRSKTVQVHYTITPAAATSSHTVLIDLSSTTVWPNPTGQTGYVNITGIRVNVDKLAASTCTVKLGVVTWVNESSGTVKYFYDLLSAKNVSNTGNSVLSQTDNSFRCLKVIPGSNSNVLNGKTPYLISNDLLSSSTAIQTGVLLPSVNSANGGPGTTYPGVGDIIASVVNHDGTNTISVSVDLMYHHDSR